MKIYVIDIDGTICSNTFGEYEKAKPFYDRIKFINILYERGNLIKFFTARGSTTKIDWTDLTKKQLEDWGVNYHELLMGKPEGDIFIDDKAFNSERWDWEKFNLPTKENINIDKLLQKNIDTFKLLLNNIGLKNKILEVCNSIKLTFKGNGKILFAGNGGSFSDSQHISTEFVARYKTDRIPLPSIALGTNSSNLTAIGNDFGFEYIFSREFEAIVQKNDTLIALTTSGNSQNIVNLILKAKELGITFFIFTGSDLGKIADFKENCLCVPSNETAIIQQCHISLLHLLVEISEEEYTSK